MNPIIHYPAKEIKYSGCIVTVPGKKATTYKIMIRSGNVKYSKTLKTYNEALLHLRAKNIELNLPIKNMIYEYADYMEVDLTQDKRMKFDKEDIELVESRCWCVSDGYAVNLVNHRIQKFHNELLIFTPTNEESIDHINRDRLDNRAENLRIASIRTQLINRNKSCNKTSDTSGVFYSEKSNQWFATWVDDNGNACTKSFYVKKYGDTQAKQLAINHRKYIEQILPHYIEAL
jgi:hypothetical protein